MKHLYRPAFSVGYKVSNDKLYVVNDSTIESHNGSVFSIGSTPTEPGYSVKCLPWGIPGDGNTNSDGYAQANTAYAFNGGYNFTLNGYNDCPHYLDFLNGQWIAVTRHLVYTSPDKINWTPHRLPSFVSSCYVHKSCASYSQSSIVVIGRTYYSYDVISPAITLLNYYFQLPDDFSFIPEAFPTGNGVVPTVMPGYVCKNGYWSPADVSIVGNTRRTSAINPTQLPIKISDTGINAMLTYQELDKYWDPTMVDDYGTVTGGVNNKATYYQFVCCGNGIIKYRLFTDYNGGTSYNTVPFIGLDLGVVSPVTYVASMQFTYDPDSYYQDYRTYVYFDRRYAVTGEGIYRLVWDGTAFNATKLAVNLTGTLFAVLYEYQSKWDSFGYWGHITRPEVHKLHLYMRNGLHVCIDASDKDIEPLIGSDQIGINFVDYFVNVYNGKNIFVTSDNKLFVQTSYTSFSYLTTVPGKIISISSRGNVSGGTLPFLHICTVDGVYRYTDSNGLSPIINYEVYGYDGYTWNVLLNPYGSMSYVNGQYIYTPKDGSVYFSTDLNNWQFKADSSNSYGLQCYWSYLNGRYILHSYNSLQYLDEANKRMVKGIDPMIPAASAAIRGVVLNNKFYMPNFTSPSATSCTLAIYDPASPTYGLRLPTYSLTATTDYNHNQVVELSRMTFSCYVNSPVIRIVGYGKYYGMAITVYVSPITGQLSQGMPGYICAGNDSRSQQMGLVESSCMWEYSDGQYTPGIKTFSLCISKMTSYDSQFDFTLLGIYIDEVNILGANATSLSYSITGDSWSGVVPHALQYHTRDSDPVFCNLYNIAPGTSSTYELDIVVHSNDIYLLKGLRDNQTMQMVSWSYYTYNRTTNQFVPLTNSFRTNNLNILVNHRQYAWITWFMSSCTLLTDTELVANDYIKGSSINGTYPLSVLGTNIVFGYNYDSFVTGVSGRLVVYHAYYRYYLTLRLNTTVDLLNAIQIVYVDGNNVTQYRTIVIGTAGYLAYTDNAYASFTEMRLGSTDLVDICSRTVGNDTYLVVVGKGGSAYGSVNNGSSWQALQLTTSDINCVARHNATSKYVMAGDNFLAVSTDLTNWSVISTGLTFVALTATEYNNIMYIGCKAGKLISSSDLYYWSYLVSNTASDIATLKTCYWVEYQNNHLYITGVLGTTVGHSASDLVKVGDKFYYQYGSGSSTVDGYQEAIVTSVDGAFFDASNANKYSMQTYNYTFQYFKQYLWTDVFKRPAIKIYADEACTKELNQTFYTSTTYTSNTTYTLPRQGGTPYIQVTFDAEVDVSTIQYVSFWMRAYYSKKTAPDYYGQVYTVNVEEVVRLVSIPVASYNTNTHTVMLTDFYFPADKAGYIGVDSQGVWNDYYWDRSNQSNSPKFIGIPYGSLYNRFVEDAGKCETATLSIWLKATDLTKWYDNLIIMSRATYGAFDYKFEAYTSDGVRSRLHNNSPVEHDCFGLKQMFLMRPYETANTLPNTVNLYGFSPAVANFLSVESKLLTRGLVLDISSLTIKDIDQTDYIINQSHYWQNRDVVTLTASNKYYNADIWAYTNPDQNNANVGYAFATKAGDIITIPGDVTYTLGDVAGSGYVYLRSVNADFSPLRTITGTLLFDGFYFTSDSWYYVSPTLLCIRPYVETDDNGHVTFRAVLRSCTSQVKYVTDVTTFDYSSAAKQSLYTYDGGSLLFSLDQFPGVFKPVYELPAVSGSTPVKVNIHSKYVNNGVKFLPHNIIRISGIEYQL